MVLVLTTNTVKLMSVNVFYVHIFSFQILHVCILDISVEHIEVQLYICNTYTRYTVELQYLKN